MAKMFYTLEEVCEKLGKTEDEVREMASSGQIQEFRDRDKLMFKVDQIDLISGDGDDDEEFTLELEDTSLGGSSLNLSGTGIPLTDTAAGTGSLSVFDTEHGGEDASMAGPSGLSGMGTAMGTGTGMGMGSGLGLSDSSAGDGDAGDSYGDELSLEAVGSGSGLLDLTRESDDTSFGADLLEEVYSGDEHIEIPANASGLFEASGIDAGPEEAVAAASIAPMPMVVEASDGKWSGLGVGMMIAAIAALVIVAFVVIVEVLGARSDLAQQFSENLWMYTGILGGVAVVLGIVGLLLGKALE